MELVLDKYKQSEVGLIPSDWEVCKIQTLIDKNIIVGHLDGNHGALYPRTTEFVDDGIPYISATDFPNGEIDFSSCKYLTKERCEKFKKGFAKNGDILFAHNATVGPVAKLETTLDYVMLSTTATYYRCDNSRLLSNYLKYVLQANYFVRQYTAVMSQSTRFQVPITAQRKFSVAIPAKAEQTAIASALSDMDDLLNNLSTLIEKKKAIKQGAMQQLLKPKEGWVVKKLGEVIKDFQNGYGFSAAGYVSDGTPIVTMAQIGLDGTFNFDETKVNKWVTTDFDTLKNFHLKDGDLIIAMTDVTPEKNLVGRMAIVKTEKVLLLNQRVGLLRLDISKVNPYFLKTLSNMRDWRLYCIGSASLGVQANLGTKDIMNGEITLPLIEEQDRIANILSDMDYEIQTLELNLSKHQMLKHGMMQELLTGKTRLI